MKGTDFTSHIIIIAYCGKGKEETSRYLIEDSGRFSCAF